MIKKSFQIFVLIKVLIISHLVLEILENRIKLFKLLASLFLSLPKKIVPKIEAMRRLFISSFLSSIKIKGMIFWKVIMMKKNNHEILGTIKINQPWNGNMAILKNKALTKIMLVKKKLFRKSNIYRLKTKKIELILWAIK